MVQSEMVSSKYRCERQTPKKSASHCVDILLNSCLILSVNWWTESFHFWSDHLGWMLISGPLRPSECTALHTRGGLPMNLRLGNLFVRQGKVLKKKKVLAAFHDMAVFLLSAKRSITASCPASGSVDTTEVPKDPLSTPHGELGVEIYSFG